MRKWIDFMAILVLAFVWMIGTLLMNQGVPIPEPITLMLFGVGMISSAILIKTNYPLDIVKPSTSLRNKDGGEEGREGEQR